MIAQKAQHQESNTKNSWLETSYLQGQSRQLKSSSSVAHFLSRTRGKNKSFQFNNGNGFELSLSKILNNNLSTGEKKKTIRPSHSLSKHCKQNSSQLESHKKLETKFIPDPLRGNSSSIKKPELLEGSRQLSIFSNKKMRKTNNIQESIDSSVANKTITSKKRDSPTSISHHPAYSNSSIGDQSAFKEIWKVYTSMKPQRKSSKNRNASRNRTEHSFIMSDGINKIRPRRNETEGNSELDSAAIFTDTTTAHTAKYDHLIYVKSLTSHFLSSLQEIDDNKEQYSGEELLKRKTLAAQEKLKEIFLVAPCFTEILEKIFNVVIEGHQDQYSKYKSEGQNLKEKYLTEVQELKDSLKTQNNIIDQLKKERNDQKEEIAKHKETISELKKQITLSLLDINSTKGAKDDSKKIDELTEDVNLLYSENKKLAVIAKKLYSDLQKSKKREKTLISMLKGEDILEILEQEKPKEKWVPKLIEVGTKKVQIPILDFSKLPKKRSTKLKVVDYDDAGKDPKKQIMVLHGDGSQESEEVFEDSSEELSVSVDDLMASFIQKMGESSKYFSSQTKNVLNNLI